jgi:GntR family transcriptional regulator
VPTDSNIHAGVPADQTLSQRIASDLRASIHCGAYLPGHRLPSGRVLMRKYGVARQTAQNAFDILRSEGLTVTRAGAGTFVRDRPSVLQLARNRLERSARITGRDPAATDALTSGADMGAAVTTRTEPADEHSADALGLQPGEELLVRERVMHADGEPVQLATSRLPKKLTTGALAGPGTSAAAQAEQRAGETGHRTGAGDAATGHSTGGTVTPIDHRASVGRTGADSADNTAAGSATRTSTGPGDRSRDDDGDGTATTDGPASGNLGPSRIDTAARAGDRDRATPIGASGLGPATDTGTASARPEISAGGVDARLAEAGHVLDHFVEYVSTRPAKPAEASSLMLTSGAPVLCVTRIAFDQRGTAVELNDMVLSGERYQLVYELHAD